MEKILFKPAKIEDPDVIEKALNRVEAVMLNVVNSDVDPLTDASKHILLAGGKRVRPRLIMLAYAALGGANFKGLAPVAAALELVHTASVVHDDINDHGVMRRGRPSVNKLWGRTFALLTGDFLFTKVYELMAPYGDLNIIFAEATVALVEGETLQASAVKESNFTREVYMDIIARKTASLFKGGAELAATYAQASTEEVEAMGRYGYNVGLAFQIIDDILDIVGDEKQLGKTAGIDLEQGKGFVSANGQTENGHGASSENGDMMENIKAKLLDNIDEARMQAQSLVMMAIEELNILPESSEKEQLIELAHSVVDRTV